MKIALVVHDYHNVGGHSRYTRILADAFSPSHDVTVFANRCERPTTARWKYRHVPAMRRLEVAKVYTFPIGLATMRRELAEYDIVHAQGYCGGEPNVVTAHICAQAYARSATEVPFKTRLSLRAMGAADARFYRRSRGRAIAISRKIAGELRSLYDFRGPIEVIHHGVDLTQFSPDARVRHREKVRAELRIPDERTIALYVGDLTKAHTRLRQLNAATPGVDLVVVSRSSKFRWQAPNVHFVAPTAEIERYYGAADALVFPSTYDAFGMVVLEAMACGIPAFSSDQAGVAELIQHGRDGFVAPLDAWIECTRDGLGDRSRLRDAGLAAAETARRHGWTTVVDAVAGVYESAARR